MADDPRAEAEREFSEGKLTRAQFFTRLLAVGMPFLGAVGAAAAQSPAAGRPAPAKAPPRQNEEGVLFDERTPMLHMEIVATGVDLDPRVAARIASAFESRVLDQIRKDNRLAASLQIAKRKKVKKYVNC